MRRAFPLSFALPALAALMLAGCAKETPVPEGRRALLWTVESPTGAQAWLLGTMHVTDPRVTKLAPAAEAAFADAGAVWTELLMTPTQGSEIALAGLLPAGQDLWTLVGPELEQRLRAYLREGGLDPDMLGTMQPWMVELLLAQIEIAEYIDPSRGEPLDKALITRARRDGKRIGEVETTAEQIAALSSGSVADQVYRLRLFLDRIAEDRAAGRDPMAEQVDLYLLGDADGLWRASMEEIDLADPVMAAWWEQVYTLRNRRMAERILASVRDAPQDGQLFALGSLHFLGDQSVVALLQQAGWTVERTPAQ